MAVVLVLGLAFIVLWRAIVTGGFYVEFDGGLHGSTGAYYVWRRSFDRFDTLHGVYETNGEAMKRIDWVKLHPPGRVA